MYHRKWHVYLRCFTCMLMFVDRRVLSFILSDKDREEVVNEIHEYLRQVGEEIRKGEVSLEKFIINKVNEGSWCKQFKLLIRCIIIAIDQEPPWICWCQEPTTCAGGIADASCWYQRSSRRHYSIRHLSGGPYSQRLKDWICRESFSSWWCCPWRKEFR